MADIPQEVREEAELIAGWICGCANFAQRKADVERLLKYREEAFLAGKRAGMERAAEIAYRTCAETRHVSLGDKCTQAIRSEADGHG